MPYPLEWFEVPPKTLVCGRGPYSRALAAILNAAEIDDSILAKEESTHEGIPPPFQSLDVILPLADGDSTSAVLWRHRCLWQFLGEIAAVRLTFVATDGAQAHTVATTDVLGRNPAMFTFRDWNNNYAICQRAERLEGILKTMNDLEKASWRDWRDIQKQDTAGQAVRSLLHCLQTDVADQILEQARVLVQSAVPRFSWEQFFPPPSDARHADANAVRRWLDVTDHGTQWKQEGKRLFSKVIF